MDTHPNRHEGFQRTASIEQRVSAIQPRSTIAA